mgnify:CR=1 FL=1
MCWPSVPFALVAAVVRRALRLTYVCIALMMKRCARGTICKLCLKHTSGWIRPLPVCAGRDVLTSWLMEGDDIVEEYWKPGGLQGIFNSVRIFYRPTGIHPLCTHG